MDVVVNGLAHEPNVVRGEGLIEACRAAGFGEVPLQAIARDRNRILGYLPL